MKLITDKKIKVDFLEEADRLISDNNIRLSKIKLSMLFTNLAREANFDFLTETRLICQQAFESDDPLECFMSYCEA